LDEFGSTRPRVSCTLLPPSVLAQRHAFAARRARAAVRRDHALFVDAFRDGDIAGLSAT